MTKIKQLQLVLHNLNLERQHLSKDYLQKAMHDRKVDEIRVIEAELDVLKGRA